MTCMRRSRRTNVITAYVIAVVILFLGRQLFSPASEPVQDALIFISDFDSIDASRNSNTVYRIGSDGRVLRRIVGSIPHGDGYLRTTDVDCHAASQQLVIASHWRDLNGFHHALLDGTGLHLDQPAAGDSLAATRQIAIAPDGTGIVVSRQFDNFEEPRFGLVAGDLFSRDYRIIRGPSAQRSYISPDYSPNGRLLVYIVKRQGDADWASRLVIALPTGGQEQVIFETGQRISEVAWSPIGDWLALVVDGQIYRIHGYGGDAPVKLTDGPGGGRSPRWSPDGERISYVTGSTFPGHHQLMIMNADGTGKQRVTNIRGGVTNGCWV